MSRANNLNAQTRNEYHSVSGQPLRVGIGSAFGNLNYQVAPNRDTNLVVFLGDGEDAILNLPVGTEEGFRLCGMCVFTDANTPTLTIRRVDGSAQAIFNHSLTTATPPVASALADGSNATFTQVAGANGTCSFEVFAITSMGGAGNEYLVKGTNLGNMTLTIV